MTQWGLDTIFNPAKRHMDDEKRRLQSTREEVGDNSGGKRIDFESGKVRIPGAAEDAEGQPTADDGTADSAAVADNTAGKVASPKGSAGKGAAGKGAAGKGAAAGSAEPTAAQLRAAARRGRKLD